MTLKEKLSQARRKKKYRVWVLLIIIAILAIMAFVFEKVRWFLIWLIILMLTALWLEVFNYDIDLWKLWETWNLKESRVETVKDKNWDTIKLIWSCVKADVNCDNFKTQGEAQSMYDKCAAEIKKDNPSITDPKKLDIYGLDRDHDWIVCEHLPKVLRVAK